MDGKVRTDPNFPCGFMDVLELKASNDKFRLLYDTKGRFVLHRLKNGEEKYKKKKENKRESRGVSLQRIMSKVQRTMVTINKLLH